MIELYTRTPFSVSMKDGALLHGEEWRLISKPRRGKAPAPLGMPLFCLPSELGNSTEYEAFLEALMRLPGAPAKAFTLDMRGRGKSTEAPVHGTSLESDGDDLVAVMDVLGLHHMAALASGWGALPLFHAVVKRPGAVSRLILNDAAPTLDSVGIARQTALRQRHGAPANWDEAAEQMQALLDQDFPNASPADFLAMAKRRWRDDHGKPALNRSADLQRVSNTVNYDERPPEMWKEFALFNRCPTLLVRGEHSSLLSEDIAGAMADRHGKLVRLEAKDQGHIPDLAAVGLPEAVLAFLRGD
ncbi:MAG: alpha/beta hydrolase [Pseudomonadota bacterium]